LISAGFDVDFVGGQSDGLDYYDDDHEGHGGFTPAEIAVSLNNWLIANPPEVILLHIGTNELDVAGVEDILNIVDGFDPNITVVLARIINTASFDPAISQFNDDITAMAEARIVNGDKILIVDHENALIYPDDMSDEKHPNNSGYAKMETVWFEGLRSFLPSCLPTTPQISSQAPTSGATGATFTYAVKAVGHPSPDFALVTAPAGMTIHPDTGYIEWVPDLAGDYDVEVSVTNDQGSDTQAFVVTVN
jgi:hypothetical protein